MKNPYLSLIATVWRYGVPWRKAIVGYYFAYIIAQAALSLSPYAFGCTIDVLQNFTPDKLSEVIFWLTGGIIVVLLFWLFHGPARVVERKVALQIQQAFRLNVYGNLHGYLLIGIKIIILEILLRDLIVLQMRCVNLQKINLFILNW